MAVLVFILWRNGEAHKFELAPTIFCHLFLHSNRWIVAKCFFHVRAIPWSERYVFSQNTFNVNVLMFNKIISIWDYQQLLMLWLLSFYTLSILIWMFWTKILRWLCILLVARILIDRKTESNFVFRRIWIDVRIRFKLDSEMFSNRSRLMSIMCFLNPIPV